MAKKYVCPYCKEEAVEEVNACGASNYFCNHCKKLISKSRVMEVNTENKKENK